MMTDFDVTTNRIPFGLLSEDEQAALKSWPHGWTYHSIDEWLEAEPQWIDGSVYRGKPAPVVTSVWQNLYADGSHAVLYPTRKLANAKCNPFRIAVLRIDTCNGVSTAHLEKSTAHL
jgi:hypothetical protein